MIQSLDRRIVVFGPTYQIILVFPPVPEGEYEKTIREIAQTLREMGHQGHLISSLVCSQQIWPQECKDAWAAYQEQEEEKSTPLSILEARLGGRTL